MDNVTGTTCINSKAHGHYQITAEMVKNMCPEGRKMLRQLINELLIQSKTPKKWEIGIIMPVHKSGDKIKCENYRGITLLNTVVKIYERILVISRIIGFNFWKITQSVQDC